MAANQHNLFVFAYLDSDWAPCGRLSLTEDGPDLQAASFAYGLKYLERPTALEIDPVSLSLQDKTAVRGKILLPPNGLALFGGIRDAAPDAWGRRVIESRLKVPANSLPESTYLTHAGSQRVGAFDVRESLLFRLQTSGSPLDARSASPPALNRRSGRRRGRADITGTPVRSHLPYHHANKCTEL